ncbi:P-type conjugative transfer protein VirB9 [uncultured Aliivibrio sp.]|uniref:P-type conjugative transfer protein VirB9 n=1 Tax=uncultured Aliivibrio sp. TaxID=873085 RepID=UPI00260549B7|nr:P-type conjugative transfer protein VirB9 [uncultured Aliivibrio sp.]
MKISFWWLSSFVLTPCFALDIPVQSPLDSNIQYSDYQANNVVEITAYIGMATHIVFDKGEKVELVRSGFSEGWEFEQSANHLFLKARSIAGTEIVIDRSGQEVTQEISIPPNIKDWKTNLIVVTSKRNYSFLLSLASGEKGRRQNTYRLSFQYPTEKVVQDKVAATKAIEKEKLVKAKVAAVSAIEAKNWKYVQQVGKDSRNIAPYRAWDNGRFTYLSFKKNSEIPAIFMVSETGQETLVNINIDINHPDTVIIQRIAKQFVLRLDDSVVGITNQGFNTLSVDNATGTTINNVVREVKGPNGL